MDSGVTIKRSAFTDVGALVMKEVDKGVRALGFAVLEEAQNNIREQGAIDTGALLNSGYVETSKGGAREAAAARAVAHARGDKRRKVGRGKKARFKSKRNIKLAVPSDRGVELGEVKVAFAVEHAVIVESGAADTNATGIEQPARPFLMPALATIESEAETILAATFGGKR